MNRVWRIGGMRIVREWWYALVVMVLLCSYAALYSDTKQWHIAIGASPVRSFGTELGVREQYTFLGADTWFRQIPNGSDIGVPVLAAPRIVRIRIITRSEDAPTQIQLVSARIRVPLTMPGQLRRYTLYIPAYQQLQITCDTSSVRSAYLQQFCAAIVDVRGYQPLPLQSTRLWWVMMLPISLWRQYWLVNACVPVQSSGWDYSDLPGLLHGMHSHIIHSRCCHGPTASVCGSLV